VPGTPASPDGSVFSDLDCIGKIAGAREWLGRATLLNHAGNAPGMALLTEKIENARQIAGLQPIDDVSRAWTRTRHPHIKWTILLKGEAAFCLVDLHRRYTNVENNAVGSAEQRDLVQGRESTLHEGQATGIFHFHLAASFDGRRVAIDRSNRSASFENAFCVAPCTEGTIDYQLTFCRLERRDHLVEQNRDVAVVTIGIWRGIAAGTCHQLPSARTLMVS
jgi:hypothetical protein